MPHPRDAGGDHNGAPLRLGRTGGGDRGRGTGPFAVPAAARDAGGSKGAQHPSPEHSVDTLCRLADRP